MYDLNTSRRNFYDEDFFTLGDNPPPQPDPDPDQPHDKELPQECKTI